MAHTPRRRGLVLGVILALSALAACSNDPVTPEVREDLRAKYDLSLYTYDDIPYPEDNGPSDAGYVERVALGRLLFFDHILSGDHDTSCGTCHHPALAWGDGRPLGAGVTGTGLGPDRVLDTSDPFILDMPRNVPTNLNAGLSSAVPGGPPDADGIMFWDRRAASLEVQSLQPAATFDEMRHYAYGDSAAADSVTLRLRDIDEYTDLFRDAFPLFATQMDNDPGNPDAHVIRKCSIELALGAYQRELVTLTSPYDEYLAGNDDALSDAEFRGMDLFFGKAGCGGCHYGPMLSGYEMVRTGVAHSGPGRDAVERGGQGEDNGLMEHTGIPSDRYKFRTPTLRNVELTGPWFRNGLATSLRDIVIFFNLGARYPDEDIPGTDAEELIDTRLTGFEDDLLDPRVVPLGLSDSEINDIVSFMKALTDRTIDSPIVDPTVPDRVPSGLPPVPAFAPFSMVPLPQHSGL